MALACDLGLDALPACLEAHKWAWFRRYCMAARVAKALESRTRLPMPFSKEVMKKINEISAEGETVSNEHEDHIIFTREYDEQLLLWLNRSVYPFQPGIHYPILCLITKPNFIEVGLCPSSTEPLCPALRLP